MLFLKSFKNKESLIFYFATSFIQKIKLKKLAILGKKQN